jgi:hypothetical protein
MKQEQGFEEFGDKYRHQEELILLKKLKDRNKKKEKKNRKIPVHVTLYPTPMKSKIVYPVNFKTFYLESDKKLSSVAKILLNSFQDKYIYYAIDDILYFFNSKPLERNSMLSLLYSPIISLQNSFSVDFFDIWIQEIYINEKSKVNKFLVKTNRNLEPFTSISITFGYTIKLPAKKSESLW